MTRDAMTRAVTLVKIAVFSGFKCVGNFKIMYTSQQNT